MRTVNMYEIGETVTVEAEIVDRKAERDGIKYAVKVRKAWYTEDELTACEDNNNQE